MELREAIRTLDELVDDGTMYVEGDATEWSPQSDTAIGTEDVESETESLPPEAEGRSYFLEVSIAREVLSGWARHLDHAQRAGRAERTCSGDELATEFHPFRMRRGDDATPDDRL